jgi:hypothetical protein
MPLRSSAFKTILYEAPYTIVDIHQDEELMMIRFFLSCCLDFDLQERKKNY